MKKLIITDFRGFTLMELVVVISIISVIATFTLITLDPLAQLRKSDDAKRKSDLVQLSRVLELYYQDKGRYPASSAGDFKIFVNSTALAWGSSFQPYTNKLPIDPTLGRNYVYYSPAASLGQTYYIFANLEQGSKDLQACNGGNACTTILTGGVGVPSQTACGKVCNYGISSPNVTP